MRLDMALTITVLAMVLLVLLNQPALALLAGLVGIIFIGMSGESYRAFTDVEVPKAGEYPKFEEWKGLLKDAGELFGKASKTFLRTEQAVDKWSSWVKKGVYGASSDTSIYMYGPFAMVLPKDFPKDMQKFVALQNYARALAMLKEKGAIDEETEKKLLEKIKKMME